MNSAENRKLVKAMLAPYNMLKHLEEVFAAAEAAELSLPQLRKQISDAQEELAREKAKCDEQCAAYASDLARAKQDVVDGIAKLNVEHDAAVASARIEASLLRESHVLELASLNEAHVVSKAQLADEITMLTNQRDELATTVRSLEAKQRAAEEALASLRAKVTS
jgi:FtsZ-binding cell division protein ZapB